MKNIFKKNKSKRFKQLVLLTVCIALMIVFIVGLDDYDASEGPTLPSAEEESINYAPALDEDEHVFESETDYAYVIENIYIETEYDEINQVIITEEFIDLSEEDDCILRKSAQLVFDEEETRLYDFLIDAHTYLLADERDFLDEYNAVKNQWLDALPSFDDECQNRLWEMIDEESWTIDIAFPLDAPFQLSHDEFIMVYFNFTVSNPQFYLNQIVPMTMHCELGLTPYICLPAYYAFAYRR